MHQTGPLLTTLAREIRECQPIQWVRSPYAGVRLAHAWVDPDYPHELIHPNKQLNRAIAIRLLTEGNPTGSDVPIDRVQHAVLLAHAHTATTSSRVDHWLSESSGLGEVDGCHELAAQH